MLKRTSSLSAFLARPAGIRRTMSAEVAGSSPSSSNENPFSAPPTHYKITLIRSAIGLPKETGRTLEALGLRRIRQTVYHPFSGTCAGNILAVKELVTVENVRAEDVKTDAQERLERRPQKGFRVVGRQTAPWGIEDVPENESMAEVVEPNCSTLPPPNSVSEMIGIRSLHTSVAPDSPSIAPVLPEPLTHESTPTALKYLSTFTPSSILRSSCQVEFARSSGPGGQNVNKLNTKATLRFSLNRPYPTWFPAWCLPSLRTTKEYIASSNSILISSEMTRSQAKNVDDCFNKFYRLIATHATSVLLPIPDEEKKRRVERLEERAKARMRTEKASRKGVKAGRKVDKKDW